MRQRFFYVAKMIGQRFLETTSPLLYLLCVDVCCISFLFLGWKGLSKQIYDNQLSIFGVYIPCLVSSFCCCSVLSTVVFRLRSFSCICTLLLGWTGGVI